MNSIVPLIDLGQWAVDPGRTAKALDDACTTVGFFQVTGHGIGEQVLDDLTKATSAFFALPEAVKQRYRSPSPDVNRGYAARGTEGLAYSVGVTRPPDLFEAFNIGTDQPDLSVAAVAAERRRMFADNIWPRETPELCDALVTYMDAARRVADVLTDIFAAALGMPARYFGPFTSHSTDTLRVNHYQTAPGDPDPIDRQLGMGEHTDYGICTVLYAEATDGLQIIGPDGQWHDVRPEPGALLINLGDLTAQWTNDRWKSTLHRVLPPKRSTTVTNSRRSVAFFHDGNYDSLIECLPTCRSDSNPAKYPPVTAGDHLMGKLLGPRTLTVSQATQTTANRI